MLHPVQVLIALYFGTALAASLNASTKIGHFIGSRNESTSIESWLGIRFAEPPIGHMRFRAPVKITGGASTVHNATKFGNACPQMLSSTLGAAQAEDCLFLNVRKTCNAVDYLIYVALGIPASWLRHDGRATGTCVVLRKQGPHCLVGKM
jgi:hypothetical protein